MYYDTVNQIYVTVDSTGQATTDSSVASSATPKNDTVKNACEEASTSKQDKVKTAKKIAKEMEKWAKTLNQKKESFAKPLPQVVETVPVESMESSSCFDTALLERQKTSFETLPPVAVAIAATAPVASSSTVNDPFEIIRAEEEKLTDWKKLACLLCKRQFSNCELLTKHQQLSELHKVLHSLNYSFHLISLLITC